MHMQFNNLFTPLRIGNLTLKNRFILAPLGMHMFDARGGINEEGANYYAQMAKGGFGLIMTGSLITDTKVDKNSSLERFSPNWNYKNFIATCVPMNERIHSYGAKIFAQISAGSGGNGAHKSASELPTFFNPEYKTAALTVDEIKKKTEMLILGAEKCKKAEFDGVDIHALHWGYLLDEFAMSITNKRDDEYGGTLENRLRFPKEIIQGIKQICGSDFPVSVRVGLKSYIKGLGMNKASLTGNKEAGRTLEEGLEVCKLLEFYGYDALNVDVGVYGSFYHACPPIYMPKGHYLPLAAEAKKAVNIPVILSNRMNDPIMAEKAIAREEIDGVVIGRPALADPFFPNKVAKGKVEEIRPCIACNECIKYLLKNGAAVGCAVNPAITRELSYGITKAVYRKTVIVVGGGISGMEAARVAKMSGHDVTLYEACDKLGGSLIPAGGHSFKKEMRELNDWYQRELKDLGVPVILNSTVSVDMLKHSGADTAILAVGSIPVIPEIPGIDNPKCVSCVDVLLRKKPVGQNVIVAGGGLVGCEIAIECAMKEKSVIIVEALDEILVAGPEIPLMNSMMIKDLIKYYKIDVHLGCTVTSINDNGVVVASLGGNNIQEIPTDTVVLAFGFKPAPSMLRDLYGSGIDVYQTGDCNRVGNVMTAIWDAYEVARSI